MISLDTTLFYGLIELLIVLLAVSGFLLWKWRRLHMQQDRMERQWEQAREASQATASTLEKLRKNGDEAIRTRADCAKALAGFFSENPETGIAAWKITSERLFQVVDHLQENYVELQNEHHARLSELRQLRMEPREEPALMEVHATEEPMVSLMAPPLVEETNANHAYMLSLVEEQNRKLDDLQNYKRIAAVLTRKFRLVNTTNRKLMEYIDSIASHDPRFQPLHEVMDKLRENGESLDNMVNDLEREKGQIEPKISSLMLESQHLTGALILARKQLDKLMDERNSLQNRVDELEAKLEMRNKSHTRLSSKFDALRREYVSLYDLAAKGKPPKGPSLT